MRRGSSAQQAARRRQSIEGYLGRRRSSHCDETDGGNDNSPTRRGGGGRRKGSIGSLVIESMEQRMDEVFKKHAISDGTGLFLPPSVLVSALRDLDLNPLVSAVDMSIEEIDTDHDGRIDLNEFRKHCRGYYVSRTDPRCAIRDFLALDINGDGALSFDEMHTALARAELEPLDVEEFKAVWISIDVDGDNVITVWEFVMCMCPGCSMEDLLRILRTEFGPHGKKIAALGESTWRKHMASEARKKHKAQQEELMNEEVRLRRDLEGKQSEESQGAAKEFQTGRQKLMSAADKKAKEDQEAAAAARRSAKAKEDQEAAAKKKAAAEAAASAGAKPRELEAAKPKEEPKKGCCG